MMKRMEWLEQWHLQVFDYESIAMKSQMKFFDYDLSRKMMRMRDLHEKRMRLNQEHYSSHERTFCLMTTMTSYLKEKLKTCCLVDSSTIYSKRTLWWWLSPRYELDVLSDTENKHEALVVMGVKKRTVVGYSFPPKSSGLWRDRKTHLFCVSLLYFERKRLSLSLKNSKSRCDFSSMTWTEQEEEEVWSFSPTKDLAT